MMLPGKVPRSVLEKIIFKNLGAGRDEVVVGPQAGIDAAVIDLDNKSWIFTTDPITGTQKHLGWLAININAYNIEFNSDSAIVYIKNMVGYKFDEVKASFHSAFFDFERTFSLDKYEKKEFPVVLTVFLSLGAWRLSKK
jgi:hypothetical protein